MKYEKQDRIVRNCQSRINILDGSVRSGKTVAANKWWSSYLKYYHTEGDLLMTGKTLTSLERNVLSPLSEIIPYMTWSKGNKEAHILGKKVYLEGANDVRSESKIRGMTIAGHYGDEVALWPESYFKQSLARMSIEGAKMILTTNPENPNHWLKKDWIDRENELNLSHHTLYIDDNPYLSDDYVASLKKEYTGVWYDRFIKSLWVAAEGAIYDMFDDTKHVVSEPDSKIFRYWLSGDYGTATTTVFLLFGQSKSGKIYVLDEYVWDAKAKGRQKTDTEQKEDLVNFQKGISHDGFYCDPSAKSFMLTLSRGKNAIRVIPANNDVLEGIRNVSSLLSNDLLYIHKKCEYLISQMHSYVWDEKQQQKGKDKPLKSADHGADTLRYGIRSTRKYWKKLINKPKKNALSRQVA